MTKPTTHVLDVVDMSGSMASLADDVRGGFNAYVESLRNDAFDGKYLLTAVMFDDTYEPLCVAAELKDVPVLTANNYMPRGMTALLDAVGRTIVDFERATPVLADEDRVLLVVQTDGKENRSTEFTREQISAMIRKREAGGRWSCIFMGSTPDAWSQAGGLGFAASNVVRTDNSSAGTRSSYSGLTEASFAVSRGATGAEASEILTRTLAEDTGDAS